MSDEQICPYKECEAIHKNSEFLDDNIGKWYLGVVQLFCPTCGMPFEIPQENFILPEGI